MLGDSFFMAMAIGVSAGAFIFAGLATQRQAPAVRRAIAVGAFAVGGAVTLHLLNDPITLGEIVQNVVGKAILVLLAALGAALAFWRIRSFF